MTLAMVFLDEGGFVDSVLHSHEVSLYVYSGTLEVTTLGVTTHLPANHCIALPLGEPYAMRSVGGPVEYLQMAAPGHLDGDRRVDTFFTGETMIGSSPVLPDMRDPRNRNAVRFDSDSMDLRRLAGGTDVNAPTVSPSMAMEK